MKRVPWRCDSCEKENLIDLLDLQSRAVDKIVTGRGFTCEKCGKWVEISYSSTSLKEAEKKLSRYMPEHEQYRFLLKKLIHKASGMAEKVRSYD